MLGLLQRKDPGNEVGIISTQIVFLVHMSAEYLCQNNSILNDQVTQFSCAL